MILTVTLNVALDVTYLVHGVDWNGVNRVRAVHRRAGGKGVNVARVLAALGHEVITTGVAGGPTGDAVLADLALAGIAAAFTPIAAESRTTLVVSDPEIDPAVPASHRTAGGNALFNEPGPVVTAEEIARFLSHYRGLLAQADAVVMSGSLPRGVRADFYAVLTAMAADHGVPAIVDADGASLRHAVTGRPTIVKPNADELARAVLPGIPAGSAQPPPGVPQPPPGAAEAAVLRDAGAESVVVSLGADGLLAVTPQGSWRARVPYALAGNPTGAGDALVAGLALGLVEGMPWPERLRRATALGAAAVAAPVAGDFDLGVYDALHPAITITPFP
ncbi:1-phosphofructokinase family hexose kinase [Planotetraspora sp. A-T 1434]|uniref:1-phosphofructokinase family hexose kinase n=1 Tax=Planotetraspora sp. A-T 1434 TaxID=2979219 RepID=UPI0021C0A8D0|nr:1-phosphofructokinase family hexose kinase [Planotetraspora sp. A-T 1434]MCT9934652.1 1-phosphofructokinase family hexose kinase [Planotetraspora sp. A-T 1434]